MTCKITKFLSDTQKIVHIGQKGLFLANISTYPLIFKDCMLILTESVKIEGPLPYLLITAYEKIHHMAADGAYGTDL